MYCPKCGTENPDNLQLCQSCSWLLTGSAPTAPGPDAKTSGLAITSLVLAILAPFTFMLTAIPALIFGIIALVKINKAGGQLKGIGLAIAGIAAPAVLLPIFAIMMGILLPSLVRVRHLATRMVCANNLSMQASSMLVYANEYDKYPTPEKWNDLLIQHAEVSGEKFQCNLDKQGPSSYAMNENIAELGPAAPPDMVLIFESKPGWNQAGGPELLTTQNHQGDGCNIVFNDGHTEFVKVWDVNDLKWTAD
jgi:prepilin-type processing-associated H-X9-DG protein